MITQGNKDHPVGLDPWQFIKSVHWNAGGVAVLTLNYSPDMTHLAFIDPDGNFQRADEGVPFGLPNPAAGDTLTPDYYKHRGAIRAAVDVPTGRWLWENELFPITIDYSLVYIAGGSDPGHDAYVSHFTGVLGYGPTHDFQDQGVAVFNKVIDISPNGHRAEYHDGTYDLKTSWWIYGDYYGAKTTPVTIDPSSTWWNIIILDPDQRMIDWMVDIPTVYGTEHYAELVWSRRHHVAAQYLNLYRTMWVINFAYRPEPDDWPVLHLPYMIDSELVSRVPSPPPVDYTLKIYKGTPHITINADATATVKDDDGNLLEPRLTQTGSAPGAPWVKFSSNGVIP